MSDSDQTCVLLANSSTRKIWYKNQCASAQYYNDCVVVTSEQARSTPGLKATLHLKANQRFHLRTHGQTFRQACAFVWVYLLSSKRRLIPNYTMLPADDSGETCVDIEFCTPKSQKTHVQVFIGVLFTGPPKTGDQFQLRKMELTYMQNCTFPTNDTPSCSPSPPRPLCAPHHAVAPNRADPYNDCYDTGNECSSATACQATPLAAHHTSPCHRGVPVSINELSNVCDTIISKLDANHGHS